MEMTNASRLPVSELQSRCVDIIDDKKSVFQRLFRQYAARMLYFCAPLCPLTFKTGGHVPLSGIWLWHLWFSLS